MNQMFELGELGKVEAHLNMCLVDKGSSSQVRIRDVDKWEKNLRPTAVENQDESGLSSSSLFHTLLHQLNQKVHSMFILFLEESIRCFLNENGNMFYYNGTCVSMPGKERKSTRRPWWALRAGKSSSGRFRE